VSSDRSTRVAKTIRENLAELIPREIGDPRLQIAGLLSINHVDLNRDLSVARVYVSFVGGERAAAELALDVLTRARRRLRGPLARRLHLARAPELRFFVDPSAEMANRIEAIVRDEDQRAGTVPGEKPP
jgi:ribosome-binding factor A